MKGGQNLRDLQAQQRVEEEWVRPMICMICHNKMRGPYGRWGNDGGTCSKVCNDIQTQRFKEKLHDPLLQRQAGST